MLAVGVLEREPDIGDEELLDVLSSNLCRCTGYQNIVAAVRAALAELREGQNDDRERAHSGRVLGRRSALEDPPLVTGRGHFVGDIAFPHQLHMRVVRSPYATAGLRRSTSRRRWPRRESSRCGRQPTSRTCRRSISATRPPRRCAPIASRCWRGSGCAMSASRSRRCSRPTRIWPKMPPSWFRSRPTS